MANDEVAWLRLKANEKARTRLQKSVRIIIVCVSQSSLRVAILSAFLQFSIISTIVNFFSSRGKTPWMGHRLYHRKTEQMKADNGLWTQDAT